MSHRDVGGRAARGLLASSGRTGTCAVAAIAAPARKLYGVQFHPEVVHTAARQGVPRELRLSRLRLRAGLGPAPSRAADRAGDPRVRRRSQRLLFRQRRRGFHASPSRCARARSGPERVRGVYVDTGLMREGETDFVRRMPATSRWSTPRSSFSTALAGVTDPEQKRHIIGEEFVRVQERIIESRHLLDEHWILGQGTIYPDTIESGGTAKAALIKTHHNRVAGHSEADRVRAASWSR